MCKCCVWRKHTLIHNCVYVLCLNITQLCVYTVCWENTKYTRNFMDISAKYLFVCRNSTASYRHFKALSHKRQKTPINLVMSVRLSVCKYKRGSRWADIREISYWIGLLLRNSVEKSKICSKLDKTEKLTCRHTCNLYFWQKFVRFYN